VADVGTVAEKEGWPLDIRVGECLPLYGLIGTWGQSHSWYFLRSLVIEILPVLGIERMHAYCTSHGVLKYL
jgi:hypothetical protein